jgi:hypothetical protein
MKLVRIGDVILNMEQLLAVKDNGEEMALVFAGSFHSNFLSIVFIGENCRLMRAWLGRNGVNDLSTETPKFNWGLISA